MADQSLVPALANAPLPFLGDANTTEKLSRVSKLLQTVSDLRSNHRAVAFRETDQPIEFFLRQIIQFCLAMLGESSIVIARRLALSAIPCQPFFSESLSVCDSFRERVEHGQIPKRLLRIEADAGHYHLRAKFAVRFLTRRAVSVVAPDSKNCLHQAFPECVEGILA